MKKMPLTPQRDGWSLPNSLLNANDSPHAKDISG
jgi:hypothetical protein